MCDDFTICPTCKQKVYTVPLKEQCEYSGCHDWAEYTAWFREDTINGLRQVCGKHVKLSIGWKAQQEKGDNMTTTANILVIGKFKDMFIDVLDYPIDHYYGVDEDTLVVGHIGECCSKSMSEKFAEFLGIDLYDFSTHHITTLKPFDSIDPQTYRMYYDEFVDWHKLIRYCLKKGCTVIFQPNY